jgi:hypothetical protein
MWKSKRLSKLQVSGSVPRGKLGDLIETNVRLIIGDATEFVTCRRVAVESGIWSDDLRQVICSVLRRRDRLVAAPSPFEKNEILIASTEGVVCSTIERADWHAELHDVERPLALRFGSERELGVIADLAQRALALGFETDGSYWRLANSMRYWYARQPAQVLHGIQAIPRVSFATLPLASAAVGIVFDCGFLYQTERSVAYFFDPQVEPRERERRLHWFDGLRCRQAGFKGTLLYNTGSTQQQVCYFEYFDGDKTMATTGRVMDCESLYEYCLAHHKHRNYEPNDPVAYVSFKGISQIVPVPAKRLRVRVPLNREQMPKELRDAISTPPDVRRRAIVNLWDGCNKSRLTSLGLQAQAQLWRPNASSHELLPCPELVFGKGRKVAPPADATVYEYKRYYKERMTALRNGGILRFEPSAGRDIYLVTPLTSSSWPDTLHKAFVEDFTECISNLVGQTFSIHEVRANAVEEIVERLNDAVAGRPLGGGRTTVVVFDDSLNDPAPYCLLSHRLMQWSLKRVTRRTVERKWQSRQGAQGGESHRPAEQHWKSMIELTVLDTLLQMDATPWRLQESRDGYDACLAIDVGEGRRYVAMSLLISRSDSARPSHLRVTKAWPKGDSHREEINHVQLQEKMAWMFEQYRGSSFSPLQSLLVLRDGRVCGQEFQAIAEAVDHLHKTDRLQQGACVDVVDVHKATMKDLRMWYPVDHLFTNVLEGQAVYLDGRTVLVSCTGSATLPQTVTAEPCLLEVHGSADIRHVARGFFSFAQLNYSAPTKACRCALPIHLTDEELRRKLSQDMRGIK